MFTKDDLYTLISPPFANPSISIFMPTHRAGRAHDQDPIRLKNLLHTAQRDLVAAGMRPPDAHNIIAPALDLLEDIDFWEHQSDGLAVFLTPYDLKTYRVPLRLDESVSIGERFCVKPLFPLLTNDGYFYVLALSQKQVRLLMATPFTIDEIPLNGTPTSLESALGTDFRERVVQMHSANGSGSIGIMHGHGGPNENEKTELRKFFQIIDKGVMRHLATEQAPLILASVDYLQPIYREVNRYRYLMNNTGISGNPDNDSPQVLHEKAWQLLGPSFRANLEMELNTYSQLLNTPRVSVEVEDIVPAAYAGRVETLFVGKHAQVFGCYLPEQDTLVAHPNPEKGDTDLLNMAIIETYTKGGRVYVLDEVEMPNRTEVAAIFRY